jgi:HEAT repeat protein
MAYRLELRVRDLKDQDPDVRKAAYKAFGEIYDRRAVEILVGMLGSEDPLVLVRAEAAWALGEIGVVKAVDPLVYALEDEDMSIRRCTSWGLGSTGDPRAVGPLILALSAESWRVRVAAAESLSEIGDAKALDSLVLALNDEDPTVWVGAAWALGKIGDARAAGSLVQLLDDEKSRCRSFAAESLEKLGARNNGNRRKKSRNFLTGLGGDPIDSFCRRRMTCTTIFSSSP